MTWGFLCLALMGSSGCGDEENQPGPQDLVQSADATINESSEEASAGETTVIEGSQEQGIGGSRAVVNMDAPVEIFIVPEDLMLTSDLLQDDLQVPEKPAQAATPIRVYSEPPSNPSQLTVTLPLPDFGEVLGLQRSGLALVYSVENYQDRTLMVGLRTLPPIELENGATHLTLTVGYFGLYQLLWFTEPVDSVEEVFVVAADGSVTEALEVPGDGGSTGGVPTLVVEPITSEVYSGEIGIPPEENNLETPPEAQLESELPASKAPQPPREEPSPGEPLPDPEATPVTEEEPAEPPEPEVPPSLDDQLLRFDTNSQQQMLSPDHPDSFSQSRSRRRPSVVSDTQANVQGLRFDGERTLLRLPNHQTFNLAPVTATKTIAVQFLPAERDKRQVLYEEGGRVRGINIFLEAGSIGSCLWNLREQRFGPLCLTVDLPDTTEALVTAVSFNADSGAYHLVVSGGDLDETVGAGRLHRHPGAIGLGGAAGWTVFYDGKEKGRRQQLRFTGEIQVFWYGQVFIEAAELLTILRTAG